VRAVAFLAYRLFRRPERPVFIGDNIAEAADLLHQFDKLHDLLEDHPMRGLTGTFRRAHSIRNGSPFQIQNATGLKSVYRSAHEAAVAMAQATLDTMWTIPSGGAKPAEFFGRIEEVNERLWKEDRTVARAFAHAPTADELRSILWEEVRVAARLYPFHDHQVVAKVPSPWVDDPSALPVAGDEAEPEETRIKACGWERDANGVFLPEQYPRMMECVRDELQEFRALALSAHLEDARIVRAETKHPSDIVIRVPRGSALIVSSYLSRPRKVAHLKRAVLHVTGAEFDEVHWQISDDVSDLGTAVVGEDAEAAKPAPDLTAAAGRLEALGIRWSPSSEGFKQINVLARESLAVVRQMIENWRRVEDEERGESDMPPLTAEENGAWVHALHETATRVLLFPDSLPSLPLEPEARWNALAQIKAKWAEWSISRDASPVRASSAEDAWFVRRQTTMAWQEWLREFAEDAVTVGPVHSDSAHIAAIVACRNMMLDHTVYVEKGGDDLALIPVEWEKLIAKWLKANVFDELMKCGAMMSREEVLVRRKLSATTTPASFFVVNGEPPSPQWLAQLMAERMKYPSPDNDYGPPEDGSAEVAYPNVAPVVLRGRGEPPIVCGVEMKTLTEAQYAVVTQLLKAGDAGLSKGRLKAKAGGDAVNTLKRLARSHAMWQKVIRLPGRNGQGCGYRIIATGIHPNINTNEHPPTHGG
jgi:hypothetical protein